MLWLRYNKTGNLAPIDADPSPEGNILPDREHGIYFIPPAEARAAMAARGEQLHLSRISCTKRYDCRVQVHWHVIGTGNKNMICRYQVGRTTFSNELPHFLA